MNLEIIDPDPELEISDFAEMTAAVFQGESQSVSSLSLIFIGHEELRSMKRQYFNLNVYTDVISFNLNEPGEPIEGELYLDSLQIRENAGEYHVSPGFELARVVIHGCLHLCGYEDETLLQQEQMRKLEDHYLKTTGKWEA